MVNRRDVQHTVVVGLGIVGAIGRNRHVSDGHEDALEMQRPSIRRRHTLKHGGAR